MNDLDDLRYYLASAGYSPERIQANEEAVISYANASGMSADRVAYDLLTTLRACEPFRISMQRLVMSASTIMQEMVDTSRRILEMAKASGVMEESIPPSKRTRKAPYYQKNKSQWWKDNHHA